MAVVTSSDQNKRQVEELAGRLTKEVLEASGGQPELETCRDILQALEKTTPIMNVALFQTTQVGKRLAKVVRTFKRHKRTSDAKEDWQALIDSSDKLLHNWKSMAEKEANNTKKDSTSHDNNQGLPTTVAEYKRRLEKHNKDMHKNPPALPPRTITIEDVSCPKPKRSKQTGELTFVANDPDVTKILKDFHPNRTPEEVLRAGSFGGTYFRPIVSGVTNVKYTASQVLKDTVPDSWITGLDVKHQLTSSTYRPAVNKYGVKCGGSLGMWESSGWISDSDPYGWFQWYCRFYQGRRCSDDARQISRWAKSAGFKGRFRSQLCNKILKSVSGKAAVDDTAISPVIRQTLLHWGLEITPDILVKHEKRINSK